MKTVPKFLWRPFRVALKVALEEISEGADSRDIVRQGVETLLLVASHVVAQATEKWGPNAT